MLEKFFLENISKLFVEKKYEEVISNIEEKYYIKDRPPDLCNIYAVSKLLKPHNTKDDVISALDNFTYYYINTKKNFQKIEAVCNFITTCVVNSQKYIEVLSYFKKAQKLFEECTEKVGYDEKLYTRGVDLYKYVLDHKKNRKILSELFKNKSNSKVVACAYGYMSNYTYNWGIKEYFEYSKKFKNFFPKYQTKNLIEINYKQNKKIRLGFLSKDFIANHSITWLIKDTLLNLDKNKFEIYGISLSNDSFLKGSSLELKHNCDYWLNLSKLKNEQIIHKIQDQKIEILFDTGGLFHADRIEIFNSRVAPIQISWAGYANTVGLEIDYLISDEHLIKKADEKFYLEKIIKMSDIWNCHSGFKFKREFIELPAKKNKFITFGSFNNFLKISDDVVEIWSKILKKVDNSKLILKSSLNVNKDLILKKFKEYNVHNQIEFYEKQDLEDHIRSYNNIDIALDTFPYGGGLTTFEALWSGVPVITMKGFNMMSRCSESILKNAKLKNLISADKDDYVKKALYFSENLVKLEELRLEIYHNILNSPVFDSKKFAIDFQNKLLDVYKEKLFMYSQ